MVRSHALAVAAGLALLAGSVQAQDVTGLYVGLNVGATKMSIDKGAFDAALFDTLTQNGLTVLSGSSTADENDASFGGFIGYRFLPFLAVEVEYLTLGTGKYEARGDVTDGVFVDTLRFDAEADSKGTSVSALGLWPISRAWDVYGRLGVIFATTTLTGDARTSSASFKDSFSDDSQDMLYGVGTSYRFPPNWSVRLDYQRFDGVGKSNTTGESDVDRLAVSWVYSFR